MVFVPHTKVTVEPGPGAARAFTARCSCGWAGWPRSLRIDAEREAREHVTFGHGPDDDLGEAA